MWSGGPGSRVDPRWRSGRSPATPDRLYKREATPLCPTLQHNYLLLSHNASVRFASGHVFPANRRLLEWGDRAVVGAQRPQDCVQVAAVHALRMVPSEVVEFLATLPGPVRAVYEAGPTGFGLARVAGERGIDVRVVAAGKVPRASGDRVKTDQRDAERLARLLAAGELRFAFVPSVADEQFRDVIRAIEDCRGDLMRARHRLGTMLLRRDLRWSGPGSTWTQAHLRWLRSLRFDDVCSQAVFVDYLSGVEMLVARRAALSCALEQVIPDSRHAPTIATLRCFARDRHAVGRRTVRRGRRLAPFPAQAAVRVPRDRPDRTHLRPKAPPRLDHQGRVDPRPPAAGQSRPPLPPPTAVGDGLARRQAGQDPRAIESHGARSDAYTSAGRSCACSDASPPVSSRSPAPASSPRSAGRPPP